MANEGTAPEPKPSGSGVDESSPQRARPKNPVDFKGAIVLKKVEVIPILLSLVWSFGWLMIDMIYYKGHLKCSQPKSVNLGPN